MSPIPKSPAFTRRCTSASPKSRASCCSVLHPLEINRLEDGDLDAKAADPALARYRPWLRDVRAQRPHQLSDDLEKLLLEKSVAGRASWTRLFDETIAELRFPFRGQELTEPEAMNLLSDRDG